MKKEKKEKKTKWKLTETINPLLSEDEISNIINSKLATIIIEMEHNPINFVANLKNSD